MGYVVFNESSALYSALKMDPSVSRFFINSKLSHHDRNEKYEATKNCQKLASKTMKEAGKLGKWSQTDRQTDCLTDKQTDRQTDRQTDKI